MLEKKVGTKVLICLIDERWDLKTQLRQALLAMTEVDLSNNKALYYVAPDFQLKIKELPKYIKIKVMTKGYDSFKGDNLMICIGLIGKITNNSTTNYKVSIKEVIEGIGSKYSKLLKPPEIDPTILAGQEWNLSRLTEEKDFNTVYVPRDSLIYQDINDK